MKIQDSKLLEAIYKVRILGTLPNQPPFPSVEATQMAIEDLAVANPELSRLKSMNAAGLINDGPLKSLEREGFFTDFNR